MILHFGFSIQRHASIGTPSILLATRVSRTPSLFIQRHRQRQLLRTMTMLNIGIAAAIRIVLVLLFLPFSALDKVLNFRSAVAQAREAVPNTTVAMGLILIGLFVEVFMSLGVITGIADRACAFVLAGYCGVTALLWKQFWKPGDFWSSNSGQGRTLFWDFLKNFALGAGFLLVTFGTDAASVSHFFVHPLSSSHPYSVAQEHVAP
jgi:putative oxidoreductase